MEALWTFFLPKFDVVRQILEAGWLGEVRTVTADLGKYFTLRAPHHARGPGRRADARPGDLPALARHLGGQSGWWRWEQPHPTAGVNGQTSAILADAKRNQGLVHTTLFRTTPTAATIAGTRGTLVLPGLFYHPGDLHLASADGKVRLDFTEPRAGHGALYFQAAEVAWCLAARQRESPLRRLADSVVTLQAMDEICRQVGVAFIGER